MENQTYIVDLRKVQYPPNMEQQIERNRELTIRFYLEKTMSRQIAEELVPKEEWNPLFTSIETIKNAMTMYLKAMFFDHKQNMVIAPAQIRRLVAHISYKLSEEKDEYIFTRQEMEFLVKQVFEANLPAADKTVYVEDYLSNVWIEQNRGEENEK